MGKKLYKLLDNCSSTVDEMILEGENQKSLEDTIKSHRKNRL